MYQLDEIQLDQVSGGEMSTETRVIITVAIVVCPIVGVGMLVGYYANAQ